MTMGKSVKMPMTMAVLACVLLAIAGSCLAPPAAWARELQFPNGNTATLNDDGTITGTCSTVVYFVPYSNDDVNHFDVHMPDGQVLWGECIDYGYPTPANATYTFTATPIGGGAYSVIVNSGYAEWVVHTDGSYERGAPDRSQRVGRLTWTPREEVKGALTLVKRSRHLARDGAAGDGSLAGAAFAVANASGQALTVGGVTYADGETVMTLTTDGDGVAATADRALPKGTYTVREVGAPERGYLLDDASRAWSATFAISENGQRVVLDDRASGIDDDEVRGNVELFKADADTGLRAAQGDATLAGAVFEVVNRSAASVPSPQTGGEVEPGGVVCTIVTDAAGRASTTAAAVNGWELPADFNGKALTYGTYEVREASAPTFGYRVNGSWSATFTVRADGQVATLSTNDEVMRGRVVVGKVSRENGMPLEQGAGTLAGWTFEIVNRSANPVVVDGARYGVGEVVKAIETGGADGAFAADTGEQCLPIGTYEVREVQTMDPQVCGYLYDGTSRAWTQTFSITADGQTVDLTGADASCPNQVVRGDLELVKAKNPDMGRLAGVPFKITSTTTGEWHVLVTDRNGQASTAAAMNPHSARTNANDAALLADGTVDEAQLDEGAGLWFDGRTDAATAPDDTKGALPFDTYTVEELRVAANEGLDLVAFEVTVYRDAAVIDAGVLLDSEIPQPHIATWLANVSGGKVVSAAAGAVLVDTVSFDNLDPLAHYQLYGELWLVEGGQAVELLATGLNEFQPALAHGSAEMAFEIDASALAGRKVVCFERLLDADGNELASHADAEDEGQSLYICSINTTLTDDAAGGHAAVLGEGGALSLTDTVAYAGLAPNKAYSLTGALYDKATGQPIVRTDGTPVIATKTFVPTEPEGSVEVAFSFASADAAGKSIVAFEFLTCGGIEYAAHADLDDEGQTVTVAAIATTLTEAGTPSHVASAGESFNLIDAVAYDGLEVGRTYTAVGTLRDRATGEPVLDGEGNAVTGATTFTPDEPSGSVEVAFEFEGTRDGRPMVAFEVLESDGLAFVEHADLANESQTVYAPSIETTLLDAETKTHVAKTTAPCALVDTIAFEGLEPGRTYTAVGTLYDKETGKALMAKVDGSAEEEELTAKSSFTPEESSGTVEVAFEFDVDLAEKTVVAFEQVLDEDGRVVASHEDIDDENQAARFPAPLTPPETPEQEQPLTKAVASAIAKTGEMIPPFVLVLVPAAALGFALAALSVRRLQRETQIAIERGKHRAP